MMIKAFKLNKDGKIEFTLEELEQLLKEAEEEGRKTQSITYIPAPQSPTTPSTPWWANQPQCVPCTSTTNKTLPNMTTATLTSKANADTTASINAQAFWQPIEGAENAR